MAKKSILFYSILCWRMAMENDMEMKHRKKYAFEALMTIPEGRIVMKGNWVYCATADPFTAKIIFTARCRGCA